LGYSARYHATSLIAVFLALAIGILIGAEFGGDTLNSTRRDLEHSLTGNLQDARERADQLSEELGRADEFAGHVYPVLVRDQLEGKRIGLLALGNLPGDVSGSIEDALGPTGGRLVGVGVVREPVDLHALADDLSKTRFADLAENPETLTALGVGLGRQLVLGGNLLEQVRGHLFSRASGNFGRLDGVIVVRDQPEGMGPVQRASAGALESGLMSGIVATRAPAVGVESSTAEPSSVSFFQGNDLSSVDDVDLVAGRLATVFSLLGAEGSFGIKGSADRLLPDLLAPEQGPSEPSKPEKQSK
jgi:Copper transport outer membrane protein, MctB